jgi:hypothetical protein
MNAGGERRAQVLTVLALAATTLLVYVRPLLLHETLVLRDHLSFTLPARQVLADSLAAGRLPEWYDGIGLGTAFAQNPAYGVTYPPAWLVAALPMPFAADLLLVLHVLLAGVGTAALSRRLGAEPVGAAVAGATFLAGGYVTSVVVNGIAALTLAWTPLVAWAAHRVATADRLSTRGRAGLALSALFALQILSGDPAGTLTSAVLAGSLALIVSTRRLAVLCVLGAAFAFALLLAAVAVLPTLHFLADSERAGGLGGDRGTIWSMHPWRLLELIWPQVLGDPTVEAQHLARIVADASDGKGMSQPSWALGVYVSAPILILCGSAAARDRLGLRLALLAAFFVLLALGRYTPFYGLYRLVVLPERLIRSPEKHLVGALVLISALFGVGLSVAFRRGIDKRLAVVAAALGGLLLVLRGVLALTGPRLETALTERAEKLGNLAFLHIPQGLERVRAGGTSALLSLLVLAALLWLWRMPRLRPYVPWLSSLVLVGHMVGHAWDLLPTVDRAIIGSKPAVLVDAKARGALRPRVLRAQSLRLPIGIRPADLGIFMHETAVENVASRFGFADIPGYEGASTARYVDFLRAAAPGVGARRYLELFGVTYAVVPSAEVPEWGLTERSLVFGYSLLEDKQPRPRAFVTPRWEWLPSEREVQARVLAPGELDLAAVRLEGRGDEAPGGQPTPCAIAVPRPERIELTCAAPRGGYVVLLDEWRAGWSATVDGRSTPIVRADALFRAVRVEPGAHQVVFSYRTPGLRLGAILSLVGWMGLALAWLRWGKTDMLRFRP